MRSAEPSRPRIVVGRRLKSWSLRVRRAGEQCAKAPAMLRAALGFFVVAIIAALFGFTGIAAGAAGIAKILFYGFAILAVLTVIAAVAIGRRL